MPFKDPAAKRAYDAAYAAAHREKLRVYNAAYRAAHLEKLRAQAAANRASHPAEIRARDAAYRATHGPAIGAGVTAWRAAHPEKVDAYHAKYRATHTAIVNARTAAYHAVHPELGVASSARRRARKRGAPVNDFTTAQWRALQAAFDHRCAYCDKRAKGHLTQEHITPLAKGGSHTLSNIVPACADCNRRKGTRPPPVPVQPLLLLG